MTGSAKQSTDSQPRVVHVVPALFSSTDGVVGGAERYALELARHMSTVTPTTLVSFGERERQETLGQLNIRVLGKPWYVHGQRTNPFALSLLSELRGADVVHCHHQHKLSSSLAALFCRLTGQCVFVSDHGGGGWDISQYISTDRWYRGHLHVSEYSRRLGGRTANGRAHVIFGGVDTEKFSPDSRVERDGNVLFVGRLLAHKGVNDLVNAVVPGMSLEIIGQVYDLQFVQDLKSLAAEKRVTFFHDCDDAALVHAYRKASCVVLPSVYRNMYGQETKAPELLGQTLLEAMACGTPAICTDVAGMPEVVEHEVTGFIVPPNDPDALREKLIWLTENSAKANAMGRAARQRVLENFTWPAVVRRCLEIYAGQINGHSA